MEAVGPVVSRAWAQRSRCSPSCWAAASPPVKVRAVTAPVVGTHGPSSPEELMVIWAAAEPSGTSKAGILVPTLR